MELHLECIEELKKTLCFAVCFHLSLTFPKSPRLPPH